MRSSLITRIAAVVGLVLAVGLFAIAPAHAQYSNTLECQVDGDTITLTGDGFEPGTTVTFFAAADGNPAVELDTDAADELGVATVTVAVPVGTSVVYSATGTLSDGEDDTTSVAEHTQECTEPGAEVLGETEEPPEVLGDLAFTGSSTMPMITIAVGAIALGSLVLFGIRSRRWET